MITSQYHTELKNRFSVFMMILLSLLTGIIIVYLNGIVAIGLFVSVMLCLFIKKIENIFLMWLLFFPLFNVDSMAFLKINNHPVFTFDRVVIVMLFLLVLLEAAMKRRNLLSVNGLEVAMILFSVVIIYSIISGSADKFSGARIFIDAFLYPFIIYFLAKNLIVDKESFDNFINVLLIVGIYLSLMGIFEHLTGSDILVFREGMVERSGWLRVNACFKDDSTFGVIVSICFFITLYKFITCNNSGIKNIRKVFYGLTLGLLILAIFFNFYRGIWLALIVGLLAWFFFRKTTLTKLPILIFMLAIIIIPSFNAIKSTRFFEDRLTQAGTIQSRLNTFDEVIYLFIKNPIKGIGFNNYNIGGGQHNTFLKFLSETGILGTSVFMILVWFLFYYGFRNYKLSRGHLANEFSIIFICILICYSVTWIGLITGFSASINKLFFSIVGVSFGLMKNL